MKELFLTCILTFSAVFISAQDWITDFDQAKEIAGRENKVIVLVFQGSDWCAPCIKLDQEIWSTEEFTSYARDNFVMLKADFPRSKKNTLSAAQQEHNNHLAELYNTNGYFPFVVVLDKNGVVLGTTGYKKSTPEDYIHLLNSFKS